MILHFFISHPRGFIVHGLSIGNTCSNISAWSCCVTRAQLRLEKPIRMGIDSESLGQNQLNNSDSEEVPLLVEFDHSRVQGSSSFWNAVFNTTNALLGLGLLSYPFAFRSTGWSGFALLIFLSIATCYSAILIRRCVERIQPDFEGEASFREIGFAAFGNAAGFFILIVFSVEMFLACSAYIVLVADNLAKLLPFASQVTWMVIATAVMIPTSWPKNFSFLAYFGVFGIFASLFLLVVVVSEGFSKKSSPGSILHPDHTSMFELSTFPMSIGLYMSGFAGHAVFPSVLASMKHQESYNSVIFLSYIISVSAYILMGVCGYLMYGSNVEREITLNFSSETGSVIATWMTVLTPICKFALTIYPVSVPIVDFLKMKYSCRSISHGTVIFIRTSLAICTLLVAIMVWKKPWCSDVMCS